MAVATQINRNLKVIRDKGVSSGCVEQLARVMTSTESRIEKKLGQSLRLAEKHQLEARALESELRTLRADIEIAFGTREINVSLLHKRTGGASYIKGRCWWHGKQREVQIGSIPAVLNRINTMIRQGEYGDLKIMENGDLSWGELKSDEALVEAVKDIGRARLRKYIIKKLLSKRMDLDSDAEVFDPTSDEHDSGRAVSSLKDLIEAYSDDWYVQWRRENH